MAVETPQLQSLYTATVDTVTTKQKEVCIEAVDEVTIDVDIVRSYNGDVSDVNAVPLSDATHDVCVNREGGEVRDLNGNGIHDATLNENHVQENHAEDGDGFQKPNIVRIHPKSVRVPDMFGSIMSAEAQVNPHHFQVKAAADAFIAEYCCLSN